MSADTYAEALKLLRDLHPMVQAPEGARIALVAAFLPPTGEHEQNLKLRRLVEDYIAEHTLDSAPETPGECLCRLCERAREVLGQKRLEPLPLFAEVS